MRELERSSRAFTLVEQLIVVAIIGVLSVIAIPIDAASDIDANDAVSYFGYVYPSGGSGIDGALPGSPCSGSGVWNGSSTTAARVAGPCDEHSGHQVF